MLFKVKQNLLSRFFYVSLQLNPEEQDEGRGSRQYFQKPLIIEIMYLLDTMHGCSRLVLEPKSLTH